MSHHQTQTSVIPVWKPAISEAQSQPLLVNSEEACRLLGGICDRTLFSLKKSGDVPHVRIGRRVLYRVADLQEFVKNQSQAEGDDES